MTDDVEQIEAKLAAYVDGQLTGPDREEIERHLQANPSHQALIRDLIAQRSMLQVLPRERAPSDLADSLQSQLERESLLGGEPFLEAQAYRQVNRWPQALAAAAILLLALGLGAIVYFVLPPKHPIITTVTPDQRPDDLAHPFPTTNPAEPLAAVEAQLHREDAPRPSPSLPGPQPNPAETLTPLPQSAGTISVLNDKTGPSGAITVNTASFFRDAPDNQTLVITVKAADVKLVNEELIRYLSANNIPWSPAEHQALALASEPLTTGENAAMARTDPQAGQLPSQQDTPLPPEPLAAAETATEELALKAAATPPDNAPQAQPLTPLPSRSAASTLAKADEPSTPPADSDLRPTHTSSVERLAGLARDRRSPIRRSEVRPVTVDGQSVYVPMGQRIILARNINTHQLAELTLALAKTQHASSSHTLHFHYATDQPPQTQPTTQPAASDTTAIGADAIEHALGRSQPDARPLSRALPPLLGRQYRSIAEPTTQLVSDMLSAGLHAQTAPAPLDPPVAFNAFPTTRSATMPSLASPPTSQPSPSALATTQLLDLTGPFNCVIVLADTDETAPETQPATNSDTPSPPATQPATPEPPND